MACGCRKERMRENLLTSLRGYQSRYVLTQPSGGLVSCGKGVPVLTRAVNPWVEMSGGYAR